MQKPVPMDHLVCGDVGFGKTEIAFFFVSKVHCIVDGTCKYSKFKLSLFIQEIEKLDLKPTDYILRDESK